MSAFSSEWLALREIADTRARDPGLCAKLSAARPMGQPLRVVDLGSGTGANLRYLAPRLGHGQHWLLLDNDSTLIDRALPAIRAWAKAGGHTVDAAADETRIAAREFSAVLKWRRMDLAGQLDAVPLHDANLVTASALLDLVSHEWIDTLAGRCRDSSCAVLFALSYDGRISWQPALPADEEMRELLNYHQHRDKGFGPAAGPEAASAAAESLRESGFHVERARSDWKLSTADAELQATLARGWAAAACELESAPRRRIQAWLEQRLSFISRDASQLTVGHVDLLALP